MEAEHFFHEADVIVVEHFLARLVEQVQLVVVRDQLGPRFIAALALLLLIEAVNDCLVADAAHHRHKDFQVSVFVADLLVQARLQKRVKTLYPHLRLTLAVKDAQQIEFVNSKSQAFVFLKTFLLAVEVCLVLEHDKDVVLHEKAPVETRLIV